MKGEGYYLCIVPNNGIGKFFIRALKQYLNRGYWELRLRGRHSDRKRLYQRLGLPKYTPEVPIKHAERIAVYINPK